MPSSSDDDQREITTLKFGTESSWGSGQLQSLLLRIAYDFDGVLDLRLKGKALERHEPVTTLLRRKRLAVDDDHDSAAAHYTICAPAHDAESGRDAELVTLRVGAAGAPDYWLDVEAQTTVALFVSSLMDARRRQRCRPNLWPIRQSAALLSLDGPHGVFR